MLTYHIRVHTEHKKGSSTALLSINQSDILTLQEGYEFLQPVMLSALDKPLEGCHQGMVKHRIEASFEALMLCIKIEKKCELNQMQQNVHILW